VSIFSGVLFCLVFILLASSAGFLVWKSTQKAVFSSRDGFLWRVATAVVSLLIPTIILLLGRRFSVLLAAVGLFLLVGVCAWGIYAAIYRLSEWHMPTGLVAALGVTGAGIWMVLAPHYQWTDTRIPLPDEHPEVMYQRQSIASFVGVEHDRRLRIDDSETVELPVEPTGRDTVNVFLRQDSSGSALYLHDWLGCYAVDLDSDSLSRGCPDTLGNFLGVLETDTSYTVHFVPATKTAPADSSKW